MIFLSDDGRRMSIHALRYTHPELVSRFSIGMAALDPDEDLQFTFPDVNITGEEDRDLLDYAEVHFFRM